MGQGYPNVRKASRSFSLLAWIRSCLEFQPTATILERGRGIVPFQESLNDYHNIAQAIVSIGQENAGLVPEAVMVMLHGVMMGAVHGWIVYAEAAL